MKKFLAILCTALFMILPACSTLADGTHGVKPLELMTDMEFNKWKLYIELTTRVGATRLMEQGAISPAELTMAANAIDNIKNQPVDAAAGALIVPALQNAGFTNDEAMLVLLIVEQELLARGALRWINPDTGQLDLSPRTEEVLHVVATALLSVAGAVSEVYQTTTAPQ